jgi:hypothetical protein
MVHGICFREDHEVCSRGCEVWKCESPLSEDLLPVNSPLALINDRSVEVDHTTIFCWIQVYAEELEKRIRPHMRMGNGSWRVGGRAT